jgi:outer membrane protein
MKRNVLIAVFMMAVFLMPAAAMAQISVGYVDVARVMEESPQAEGLSRELQQEFEPAQTEMREQQNRMQELQQRLERDADVMSDEERRDIQMEIRDIQRNLQRRQSDLAEDFNVRRNEALGSLQRLIMNEVRDYASENNLDLVVGEGVFYASDQIDITDAILDRLRERAENGS